MSTNVAIAVVALALGLLAAACGDDDNATTPTPASTASPTAATVAATASATEPAEPTAAATGSPSPVPIPPLTTADDPSWGIFLDSLSAAVGRADVAFLTARLRAEEGICTAADLTPTIDQHRCSRVGDTYQDFPLSFSGEAARASLSAVAASLVQTFDRQSPGATDTWGSAALHVYAASADTAPRHTAFVTGILAGEPGPERIVEAWTFEFDGSNWRLVAASVETHPEQLLRETTPPFPGRPDLRAYP